MRSIPAQIKSYAPGFALALVIALLAKGIEALLPFDVIGASVIAMFIGMLINGYRKPGKTTAPGVKFTAKKILKFAIILLGASLNVTTILNVGRMSLTVMLFTLLTCFGGGYFIGRAFRGRGYATEALLHRPRAGSGLEALKPHLRGHRHLRRQRHRGGRTRHRRQGQRHRLRPLRDLPL